MLSANAASSIILPPGLTTIFFGNNCRSWCLIRSKRGDDGESNGLDSHPSLYKAVLRSLGCNKH
ncbi:hypothetical protein V1477_007698 [Vespula maculifrons]|uniref:Uncharacterized protein n=1 Tax=Vespula maculifrons TaxID=7453 RepID=A0ABD2CFG9_VESMC